MQTDDLHLGFVCRGGVAQLGERLVRNQKVVSSILITSTINFHFSINRREWPECKAHGAQRRRHTIQVGEEASTAQRRNPATQQVYPRG